MPEPMWTWCPMPGATRSTGLRVESNAFGDGYTHRVTRGINPVVPAWQLTFPFVGLDSLKAMDDFLRANALGGFYIRPPDSTADVFVTADDWQATVSDKNRSAGIVGTLQATFTQAFNPQPLTGGP